MNEVIQIAISPTILPLTVFLGVCLLYWCMVFLGFIEAEMVDFAHQFELDLGDLHVDGDHGFDGHDHGHDGADGHEGHGLFGSLYTFFIGTDAPMMVPITILALSMWTMAMICAYYMNTGGLWLKATLIFIPIFIASLFVMKFASIPFNAMFKVLNTDYDAPERVVGKIGKVASLSVTERHGQVEIEAKGAPLLLNVVRRAGPDLKRGDEVVVLELLEDKDVYLVRAFDDDLHGTTQKEEETS